MAESQTGGGKAFETSPVRLWKSLAREERLEAASAFWRRPAAELAASAAEEIVKILRVRPQAFHKIPLSSRVRALAGLAHPPEEVAEGLLLALHLEARRPLLTDFLDALGIAHEEGVLQEGAPEVEVTAEGARRALAELRERHGGERLRIYWNALWLQDPRRWAALAELADEL